MLWLLKSARVLANHRHDLSEYLFSFVPLQFPCQSLLLRFGLALEFRGHTLAVERLEFERPLHRDGLGNITLVVIACLISERTFQDHLAALVQQRFQLRLRAHANVLRQPNVAAVHGYSFLNDL